MVDLTVESDEEHAPSTSTTPVVNSRPADYIHKYGINFIIVFMIIVYFASCIIINIYFSENSFYCRHGPPITPLMHSQLPRKVNVHLFRA